MKTKLLTLIIVVFLGAVNMSFAGTVKPERDSVNPSADPIISLVKEQLQYPEFAKQESIRTGVVIVEFLVDEHGDIQVLGTNQSDVRFRNYVIEKLKSLNVGERSTNLNAVYQIKLNFRLI